MHLTQWYPGIIRTVHAMADATSTATTAIPRRRSLRTLAMDCARRRTQRCSCRRHCRHRRPRATAATADETTPTAASA